MCHKFRFFRFFFVLKSILLTVQMKHYREETRSCYIIPFKITLLAGFSPLHHRATFLMKIFKKRATTSTRNTCSLDKAKEEKKSLQLVKKTSIHKERVTISLWKICDRVECLNCETHKCMFAKIYYLISHTKFHWFKLFYKHFFVQLSFFRVLLDVLIFN